MEDKLPPNILITGSFRSGTTLLYLLFPHAFENVIISGEESDAFETLLPAKHRWRVSKRPNDIHRVRVIHKKLNPYFIYMIRDPRDCIISWKAVKDDYHLSYNEWQRNLLFAESSKSPKMIFIKFEDLILHPNETQTYLMTRIVGLEKRFDLSESSKYADPNSPVAHQLTNDSGPTINGRTIRPMDPAAIRSWVYDKERIREQLAKFPEIQAALEKYGYEKDDTWQKLLDE